MLYSKNIKTDHLKPITSSLSTPYNIAVSHRNVQDDDDYFVGFNATTSDRKQERWEEMDWDSNGDISFGEFVYAFTKWVDVETGDEDTVEHMVSVRVRLSGQERAHFRGYLLSSST